MFCSECSILLHDTTAEELGVLATVSPALFTSQEILSNIGTDAAHECRDVINSCHRCKVKVDM